MRLLNTKIQYGLLSIILHWTFALSILLLLTSGIYMVTLTYYHPWYHPLPSYHKMLGIFTIFLLIVRSLWHFFHLQPSLDTDQRWEALAAKLVHWSMLLLSAGILFSGYLIISVDVTHVLWLGVELPVIQLNIENQASYAGVWHKYLTYALAGFLLVHIGATLKHQLIDKKPLLQKIFGLQ